MSILTLSAGALLALGAVTNGGAPHAAIENATFKADLFETTDVDYYRGTFMRGERIRASVSRAKNSQLFPNVDLENNAAQSVGINLRIKDGRRTPPRAYFGWKTIDTSGDYAVVVSSRKETHGAYDAKLEMRGNVLTERRRDKGTLDADTPHYIHSFEGMEGATFNARMNWGRRDVPLRLVSINGPDGTAVPGYEDYVKTDARNIRIKKLPLKGRLGMYTLIVQQVGADSPGKVEGRTKYNYIATTRTPERPKHRNAVRLMPTEPSLDEIESPIPVTPGSNVIISGENFSADEGVTVLVGDDEATVCCATETTIEITMPVTDDEDENGAAPVTVINSDSQTVTENSYVQVQQNAPPPPPPPPATPPAPLTPPPVTATSPTAAITVLSDGSSGTPTAPYTVHVHGTDSILGQGNWQEAEFEWSFGDSGAQRLTTTDPRTGAAVDLNAAQRGFNAAYVYKNPGTYTITLVVRNKAGEWDRTTTTVTVGTSQRTVRYVDSKNGSDSNAGTSTSSAWKSLNHAASKLGNNMDLLLKRGEAYTLDSTIRITHVKDARIGTYGSGARPVVKSATGAGLRKHIVLTTGAVNFTMDGLRFESDQDISSSSVEAIAIDTPALNTTVMNCEFAGTIGAKGFKNWVTTTGGPTGVLVLNCPGGDLGDLAYAFRGRDHVYMGLTAGESIHQHIMRGGFKPQGTEAGMIRINTAFCSLDYNDKPGNPNKAGKGPVRYGYVQYGYLYRCVLKNGSTELGHNGLDNDYHVVDGCVMDSGQNGYGAMVIKNNAMNIMLRNNVFIADDLYKPAIQSVESGGSSAGPEGIDTVSIVNNTFIAVDRTRDTPLIRLNKPGIVVYNITFTNNLFVTDSNYAEPMYNVFDSSLATMKFENNSYASRGSSARMLETESQTVTWSAWTGRSGVKSESASHTVAPTDLSAGSSYAPDWNTHSALKTQGQQADGVHSDFRGKLRARVQGQGWAVGATSTE